MKIKVRVRQLAEALQLIKNAVLPVEYALAPSNHVYVTAEEKTIKLLATNGTDFIQVLVPADVEARGTLTLPLDKLSAIVSFAPGNQLLALEVPKHEICRYSVYPNIKGRLDSVCQVPVFPELNNKFIPLFNTEEKKLKVALEDVLPFAAKKQIERMWNICVSLRKTENGDVEFGAGGDGAMAYSILAAQNSLSGNLHLFAPAMRRLMRILDNSTRTVTCGIDEESQIMFFHLPRLSATFFTRIQNAHFPDLTDYFPKEYEVNFTVETEDLKRSLNLAGIYDAKEIILKLDKTLFVEAQQQALGEISIAIACNINRTPETFQMRVDMQRLVNVVFNIDSLEIRFQIRIRNNHLLVITPEDETSNHTQRYAIMP